MISFSTNPDSVTDLPAFNDFQLAVQGALDGHTDEEELAKVYQQLDLVLSQALFYFSEQIHFQPVSDHLEAQSQRVYLHLDGVRDESELAAKACLIPDEEAVQLHLGAARRELKELNQIFATIQAEEAAQPRFSPLPWIHELCRVAVACRQGQLSEDHLAERLETCQQLHQRASMTIPQIPSLIHDRQRWKEIIASMQSCLAEIGEGLEAVESFLTSSDLEALDAGLELCMGGAEKLTEDYETVKRLEEEQPGLHCPLCTGENPLGSQRCQHCSATLPRLAEVEEALGQGQSNWPSYVQSLLESLQLRSSQALVQVQQMRDRFERGVQDLQKMKVPEGLEAAEEARQKMLQESRAAIDSLDQMADSIQDGQWDFVTTASEEFLQRVEGLLGALPQ